MTVNDQDDTMHMKHVSMYNLISPLRKYRGRLALILCLGTIGASMTLLLPKYMTNFGSARTLAHFGLRPSLWR